MVNALCQAYQALPSSGGVLDQDVSFLRMHAVIAAAKEIAEEVIEEPGDEWSWLPMESIGG